MPETLIKKRKICIEKIGGRYKEKEIEEILEKKPGIIFINVDGQRGCINIEYNLKQVNFETIEKWLEGMEIALSKKMIEKFKRTMAKFTEQNELDNLKASPSSCCSDPKEIGHKVNR